jgi:hypothetical protein
MEEDAKLTEAVTEFGNEWVRVAALVPGRTNIKCRRRWVETLDPIIGTGKWTAEEDENLTDAVKERGAHNWVRVAALVPGRTNKQCRHRWIIFLDPNNNNNNSTGKWTVEEDAKLTEAVTINGVENWVAVATLVPGRTNAQCCRRWSESLDPIICTGKWAAEEDAKLTDAVKEHGDNKWVAVATLVPNRTNVQCRHRWANRRTATTTKANGQWKKTQSWLKR